ncbi:hypothetical protein [Nonomuraea rubra]|uniref:hypothetical protein n=1 Tax=Nonomuraea rubra TaxID=46180 RepID=UPI0031E8E1CE
MRALRLPVAVLLPAGVEALIAIVAVLEAGGAYVPLSCDDPPSASRRSWPTAAPPSPDHDEAGGAGTRARRHRLTCRR